MLEASCVFFALFCVLHKNRDFAGITHFPGMSSKTDATEPLSAEAAAAKAAYAAMDPEAKRELRKRLKKERKHEHWLKMKDIQRFGSQLA